MENFKLELDSQREIKDQFVLQVADIGEGGAVFNNEPPLKKQKQALESDLEKERENTRKLQELFEASKLESEAHCVSLSKVLSSFFQDWNKVS